MVPGSVFCLLCVYTHSYFEFKEGSALFLWEQCNLPETT